MKLLSHQAFLHNWKNIYPYNDGREVLLAVSGGGDSMVMAELFRSSAIPFAVAHCNFQLRGDASVNDEQLVKNWCFDNQVSFHCIRFETKAAMAEQKKGVQEVARSLRYDWLETTREENDYSMIATAHHANDNVETLLMNLCKGTGISGLHGIPVINQHIIRPLLFAEKKAIVDFAIQHQVPYREDASNQTDAYKRNEIRHHIVPAVEQVFPGAIQQINESISRIAGSELIYNEAINKIISKLTEQRGKDLYIPILKLKKAPAPETVCYELFSRYGFTPQQTLQIYGLTETESGHFVSCGTHRVIHHRDFLVLTAEEQKNTDIILIENAPASISTSDGNLQFSVLLNDGKICTDAATAHIDYDKLSFPLTLRKWRIGDYLYPLGMNMKKKKLSKLFIDRKLSIAEKERIWVLESDKKIVWVVGMRLDERFKVREKTETVLKIELTV